VWDQDFCQTKKKKHNFQEKFKESIKKNTTTPVFVVAQSTWVPQHLVALPMAVGAKKLTPSQRVSCDESSIHFLRFAGRLFRGWDTTLRARPVMLLPPFNNGSDQEREMAYLTTLKGPDKRKQ